MSEKTVYFDKTSFNNSGRPSTTDRYITTDPTHQTVAETIMYSVCRGCGMRHDGVCHPAVDGTDCLESEGSESARITFINNDGSDEGLEVPESCPLKGAEIGFSFDNEGGIVADII